MTQTYSSTIAHERMAANLCPECGNPPEAHSGDNRFWMPSVCGFGGLTRVGVEDRIAQYRRDCAEGADHAR